MADIRTYPVLNERIQKYKDSLRLKQGKELKCNQTTGH